MAEVAIDERKIRLYRYQIASNLMRIEDVPDLYKEKVLDTKTQTA